MEEVRFVQVERVCGCMVGPDKLLKNPRRLFDQLVYLLAWHPVRGACLLLLPSWPNRVCHLLPLFLEVVLNFHSRKVSFFYFLLWLAAIFPSKKVISFPLMQTCLHHSTLDLVWKFICINLHVLVVPYHGLSLELSSFDFISKFSVPRLHLTSVFSKGVDSS